MQAKSTPALTLFTGQRERGGEIEGEKERERERERERGKERESTPALVSIKHARTLSVPHSVSQSACVILILMDLSDKTREWIHLSF